MLLLHFKLEQLEPNWNSVLEQYSEFLEGCSELEMSEQTG